MKWSALNSVKLMVLAGALYLSPVDGFSAEALDDRYNALVEAEDLTLGSETTRERGLLIAESYDLHFGLIEANDLEDLNLEDLRLYLRATELVIVHAMRPQDLGRMELAFSELLRRGEPDQPSVGVMYRAYVAFRKFDQARVLAENQGMEADKTNVSYLDQVASEYRGPTLLKVSADVPTLTRVEFTRPLGSHIVVVSHPLCHFSSRAVAAIDDDPVLRELFKSDVVWLAPVEGRLNLDVVQSWNASRPAYPVSIAFNREEWEDIDHWATPTFYFFGEEGLAEKVKGWPREGRRAELLDAAKKAGMKVPESTDSD